MELWVTIVVKKIKIKRHRNRSKKKMIVHECTVVNSVLYVKALVVLIVYSCRLKTTTKNIIIYERIIAVLTSKIKVLYI